MRIDERTEHVLQRYDVYRPVTDKYEYQWKLRLLQSHWRVQRGFESGVDDDGKPLGSSLCEPEAREKLTNYLTSTIRNVVRTQEDDPGQSHKKFYDKDGSTTIYCRASRFASISLES